MKYILKTRAELRYKTGFIRNGQRNIVTDWSRNLILDSGLNKVASFNWANCFQFALWGNQVSPDPVRRDSSPITFTVTGTSCIASGAFFVSADAGRLIKFNDAGGQEFYITVFNSSTDVTISAVPSPAIAAQTATIWYVNETALQSVVSTGNTYGAAGGDNGTTFIANSATMKRTIIGSALGAATTLTEIGFNNSATNTNIFDRDIITGGIPLIIGDQPLVIVELVMTVNPITPLAVGNVATGFDSSGDTQLTAFSFDRVLANGGDSSFGTAGGDLLEPARAMNIMAANAAMTVPAYTPNGNYLPSAVNPTSAVTGGFTPGIWSRDFSSHWDVSTANGNIFGFICTGNDGISDKTGLTHNLTTNFAKNSTQVLDIVFTKNWGRTLVN